jgi:hypothetical protein
VFIRSLSFLFLPARRRLIRFRKSQLIAAFFCAGGVAGNEPKPARVISEDQPH